MAVGRLEHSHGVKAMVKNIKSNVEKHQKQSQIIVNQPAINRQSTSIKSASRANVGGS
jgi:hypothetical protein